MRRLAIAAAVSLSLTGMPGNTLALGLGEIEMYSVMNQSLDAEIAILSATDAELSNLQVKLASSDAFARAGLQELPVLSSVRFDVERRPDGQPVVKVTSNSPVIEPFLNFLIEIDAPGSVRLVKEYTVLLDPPSFDAPIQQADAGSLGTQTEGGVTIDLSDVALAGTAVADTAIPDAQTYPLDGDIANDALGEVSITEEMVSEETAPLEKLDSESLFVEDNSQGVFTNSQTGSRLADSNGQVIALSQELGAQPSSQGQEADVATSVGGEQIDLNDAVQQGSEQIALENLGAQDATNAIFDNEFASDNDAADVLGSEELQELLDQESQVTPVADAAPASGLREVEFTETTVGFGMVDSTMSADAPSDTIDISGVLQADSASGSETSDTGFTQTVSDDGIVVEIAGLTQTAIPTAFDTGVNDVTGETYRIQGSDTLWSVSNRLKDAKTSPHQMMVALLRSNESAFVGGNMNRMRTGAVLQVPTLASQTSVSRSESLAIVKQWTDGNVSVRPARVTNDTSTTTAATTLPVVETVPMSDVNRRVEVARSELSTEMQQRDESRNRMSSLEDSMSRMKSLLSQREQELKDLPEVTEAAPSTADLASAQEAIERQADLDKNQLTADAQAESIRLTSEEDSLRAQLTALEAEKRTLEATAQSDRAELVRQSEVEKTRLLEEARGERERIMAELESEKARITSEAEAEIAKIRQETQSESQMAVAEVETDRNRLEGEIGQLRAQVQQMEGEKLRILEESETTNAMLQQKADDEQARLVAEAEAERVRIQEEADKQVAAADAESQRLQDLATEQAELKEAAEAERDQVVNETSRIKDRLKEMEESTAELAETKLPEVSMPETDADGVMANIDNAGEKLAAGGAAAVGGLLSAAPLQRAIGDRKTILGIGALLSGLGLLAGWGLRRKRKSPEAIERRVAPMQRPSPRTQFDDRSNMYDDMPSKPANRAAAAGAATAAAAGTAAVAARTGAAPEPVQPQAPSVSQAAPAATTPQQASNTTDISDEAALDDTLTEAEVYLRYGLHGQAEDLLKTAIERSPDNEEYHFKLLECYHDQKSTEAFEGAASAFNQKFPGSEHQTAIAKMSRELTEGPSGDDDSNSGGPGALGGAAAGVAGAGAVVAGLAGSAKDAVADTKDSILDQTIDPGTEFSVDELQATGDLGAMTDLDLQTGSPDNLALDDVDLASLDDDGTLNLEEVAGDQMSGADIGSLDLTNPDGDSTFDNLTLDDADLNSLGGVGTTADVGSFGDDLSVDSVTPGGDTEMETMLDLAKAYLDMGDSVSAEKTLNDIAARGNALQQAEAYELLKKL